MNKKENKAKWTKTPGADGLLFGERLKDLIVERGTTAKRISEDTGIGESNLSAYQNNPEQVPGSDNIIALASYFNVSTDYLYGLTHARTSNSDTKAVCEYTGLTAATINALHKQPYGSLQSSFLRRFFDDLLIDQNFAECVPKLIEKYILAVRASKEIHSKGQDSIDNQGLLQSSLIDSLVDTLYMEIVADAQGDIERVINEMCKEARLSDRAFEAKSFRWPVWSETDEPEVRHNDGGDLTTISDPFSDFYK